MKQVIGYLLMGLMLNSSIASAASVGDHVYVVTGSGSDAEVWDGTVIFSGESRSKIDWRYQCSNCDDWVSNSELYHSESSAKEVADKMDSEHTSVGEASGAAAVGLVGLFLYGALCATDKTTGKPINPDLCK